MSLVGFELTTFFETRFSVLEDFPRLFLFQHLVCRNNNFMNFAVYVSSPREFRHGTIRREVGSTGRELNSIFQLSVARSAIASTFGNDLP